jgi:hypothetical protein
VDKRARSHHYVPEFHLAMFIGYPFRRFAAFDKQWGKYSRPPVATSATERNYYALPGSSIEDRLRLEREFAELENVVAPLFRRLGSLPQGQGPLSSAERDAIAGYAAILHVRGPAYRSGALERAEKMATDLEALGLADPAEFRESARAMGMIGDDAELETLRAQWAADVLSGRRGFRVPRQISLTALNPAVEKVRPMLVDRHWQLVRREDWPGFVMGDQPVALLAPPGRLVPSIGFGTPGVQVLMPISPKTLLVVSDAPPEDALEVQTERRTRTLREPTWALANKVAWLSAQRYVWGRCTGHLQATELLIEPEDRRRDLRVLDADTKAKVDAIASARRRQRREARRAAKVAERADRT